MDLLLALGSQDLFPYDDPAIDESLGWTARILTEEDVPAVFLFQAERVAQFGARGPAAISAVARHEIGLHGRDRHPVDTEVVETLDWDAGVAAVEEIEREEMASLARVFGREPVCSSQHGPDYAPQLFAVAARRGQPYLFGHPAAPPLFSVSWFIGALSVPYDTPVPGHLGFAGVYDRILPDDREIGPALDQLDGYIERCQEAGLPLLSVFLCHPERLVYPDPVTQLRYGDGVNHPDDQVHWPIGPWRRTNREITAAQQNFRRLIRFLRDRPGVRPVTVADISRFYGAQPREISRADLARVADDAWRQRAVVLSGELSPAEAILGWAESLIHWRETGTLPTRLPRRDVLGPTAMPSAYLDRTDLSIDGILALARSLLAAASTNGSLPTNLEIAGSPLGLGAVYGALAGAHHLLGAGQPISSLALTPFPRYPTFGSALAAKARSVEESSTVRPSLGTDRIALHTRLQSWTLKPARRR